MATATTTTKAGRVARFKADFLDQRFPLADESTAGKVAFSTALALAVEAIADGEYTEAAAWSAAGQLAMYRYRRSI